MKILYLCHRIPYPPNKGDKIRSFNEIKYLSRSHELHLACLADDENDLKFIDDLKRYCSKVHCESINKTFSRIRGLSGVPFGKPISAGYFHTSKLQAIVDKWLAETHYDAIICFSSAMAEYVFKSKLRPELKSKLIMDYCDLDSDKWRQYSQETRPPYNWVYRMEHRLMFAYEKKVNRAFDSSVFVSPLEANLFQCLYPRARNVEVVPNGIDYEYFTPTSSEIKQEILDPILLFVGAMDYHANVDGVLWFSENVFPSILAEFPESKFYIVGGNPDKRTLQLRKKKNIIVTGFVDDVRPYYEQADICVVPLRLARGVQNKVLEAMAMGKAIVASPSAVQGVVDIQNDHALIVNDENGFIESIRRLTNDFDLRKKLAMKAREFVIRSFDWNVNMRRIERLL